MNKEILWARKCDVTGKGMNEGYVWGDGVFYCIDDDSISLPQFREEREHIIQWIPEDVEDIETLYDNYREEEYEKYIQAFKRVKENKDTDEDLKLISYLFDLHYYTEWECKDDMQYIEVDGEVKLIEE